MHPMEIRQCSRSACYSQGDPELLADGGGGWGTGVVSTGSATAANENFKVILVLANHSSVYGVVIFRCFCGNQISV
jgi:hypothetical protein